MRLDSKRRVAIHEAGHGVTLGSLGVPMEHLRLTLSARVWSGETSSLSCYEDKFRHTPRAHLAWHLGGHAAEHASGLEYDLEGEMESAWIEAVDWENGDADNPATDDMGKAILWALEHTGSIGSFVPSGRRKTKLTLAVAARERDRLARDLIRQTWDETVSYMKRPEVEVAVDAISKRAYRRNELWNGDVWQILESLPPLNPKVGRFVYVAA